MKSRSLKYFTGTDVGKLRELNEDRFVMVDLASGKRLSGSNDVEPKPEGLMIVIADGMGGENAGEVAAEIAITHIDQEKTHFANASSKELPSLLRSCIAEAHKEILKRGKADVNLNQMGTTVVAAILKADVLTVAWVGDSRCYIYEKDQPLEPFTADHSIVWMMVQKGLLSKEDARLHPDSNFITQSLGQTSAPIKVEVKQQKIKKESVLLLCSDGLNSMLSDEEIEQILRNQEKGLDFVGNQLICASNEAGGADNITLSLLNLFPKTGWFSRFLALD